ncbi:hypothetical protein B0H65DRAFT_184768 [Neurospora tetraspora]|uniref:Uncharacterized protein n=1 Tax=Neurospora tetraspora TaxID=94610 RepID=A0AAE0JE94_9PEZI|nr:hypothetical protein B0H65DRAFT_184768 [Neurospora tetraspora]
MKPPRVSLCNRKSRDLIPFSPSRLHKSSITARVTTQKWDAFLRLWLVGWFSVSGFDLSLLGSIRLAERRASKASCHGCYCKRKAKRCHEVHLMQSMAAPVFKVAMRCTARVCQSGERDASHKLPSALGLSRLTTRVPGSPRSPMNKRMENGLVELRTGAKNDSRSERVHPRLHRRRRAPPGEQEARRRQCPLGGCNATHIHHGLRTHSSSPPNRGRLPVLPSVSGVSMGPIDCPDLQTGGAKKVSRRPGKTPGESRGI